MSSLAIKTGWRPKIGDPEADRPLGGSELDLVDVRSSRALFRMASGRRASLNPRSFCVLCVAH